MATRALVALLLALWVASADGALTWTESTGTAGGSLPVAQASTAIAVLGSKIYLMGGTDGTDVLVTVYYSTDPVANGWSTAGNTLPTAMKNAAAAVLWSTAGIAIYVMGGAGNEGSAAGSNVVYSSTDPDGLGWTTEARCRTQDKWQER